MSIMVACPECGGMLNVLQAIEDKEGRRWVDMMLNLPAPIHTPLYRYLRLFKPPRQVLRYSRMCTLTAELVEPIKTARVERNNQVHVVPLELWIEALTELVEEPPQSLRLPLKGHGYLFEMLANRAEKSAAKAEQQREEERRRGVSDDTTARRGLQSIKEALGGEQ
jgi:hypothetical protein